METNKELLEALEKNGLLAEREMVLALMNHLNTMGETLSQMTLTLQTMGEEIQSIHNRSLRGRCEQLASGAEEKVQQAKDMVASTSSGLKHGAENALAALREQGRDAFLQAVRNMKIPSALARVRDSFHDAALSMWEAAEKVEAWRQQIHEAGGLFRNAGRALLGKPVQETPALAADRGALAKVRDLFQSMEKSFSGIEKAAESLRDRIEPEEVESLESGQDTEQEALDSGEPVEQEASGTEREPMEQTQESSTNRQEDTLPVEPETVPETAAPEAVPEQKHAAKPKQQSEFPPQELDLDSIPAIMGKLADNAWYGKTPRSVTYTIGNNTVEMTGYTYEPSYECFSSTAELRLNGKVLYGLNARNVAPYQNEIYQKGEFEKLDDAIAHLKETLNAPERSAAAVQETSVSGQAVEQAQDNEEFSDVDPAAVREALQNPDLSHINEMLAFAAQAEQDYAAQAKAFVETPADIVEQAQAVQAAWAQVVGYCSWPSRGERIAFTDPQEYVAAVKEELDDYMQTGFRFETTTQDPAVHKAVDDAVYSLFGEENPHDLDYYSQRMEAMEYGPQGVENTWQTGPETGAVQPAPEPEPVPDEMPEMEM